MFTASARAAPRSNALLTREFDMRVSLRKSLFILPNLLTLGSVFCGFYAIIQTTAQSAPDRFYRAAMFIVLSMFLDALDGRVARLTHTQSAIGVQLDSLADLVAFGVAPSVLVYFWSLQDLGVLGLLVSFAFTAAGAVRLARFNVMSMGHDGVPKRPSKYTRGLPIPTAAGVLVSVAVAQDLTEIQVPHFVSWVLLLVVFLAGLMVSRIRFRSFKDLQINTATVLMVLATVAVCSYIAVRYHLSFALAWLLLSYVVVGVLETFFRRNTAPTKASESMLSETHQN